MNDYDDDDRFISEADREITHDNGGHRQTYRCDVCGSYNTYQTTYSDGCYTCGDSVGY
jgi:hypothetical protein